MSLRSERQSNINLLGFRKPVSLHRGQLTLRVINSHDQFAEELKYLIRDNNNVMKEFNEIGT